MAASDKTGTLQTATTENAVIDGEMYPVAEIVKPHITKIRANTEVHYTVKDVKGVKTLTFIKEAKPKPAGGLTEHTERSMDDIKAETAAYNAKDQQPQQFPPPAAAPAKFVPAKELSFECGGCKRLIFRYPCGVCHFDPNKPAQAKIADTQKPPVVEKKQEVKKETQPAEKSTETMPNSIVDEVKRVVNEEITSVTLGVSLRFGAYNNVKVDVTGVSVKAVTIVFDYLVEQQKERVVKVIRDIQKEMGE